MQIAHLVREARVAAGFTLEELAERCGLPASALEKVESGQTVPKGRYRRKLETLLQCELEPSELEDQFIRISVPQPLYRRLIQFAQANRLKSDGSAVVIIHHLLRISEETYDTPTRR